MPKKKTTVDTSNTTNGQQLEQIENSTVALKRVCDLIPSAESDYAEACAILQELSELERKAYVRVPAGWCVFRNGIRPGMSSRSGSLGSMLPPMTLAIRQRIETSKGMGPVIDYGIVEPGIRFLELSPDQLADLANSARTEIQWFEREAMGAVESRVESARNGFAAVGSVLRCLRPIGDEDEILLRRAFGGALKSEARFNYAFTPDHVYVREVDWEDLLIRAPQDGPFGILRSSPAVHMAYTAAKKFATGLKLKRNPVLRDDVIKWLTGDSSASPYKNARYKRSPFKKTYVQEQLGKFLDPNYHRGKGGEKPYNDEALKSFRHNFPNHGTVNDGLALIITAAIEWKAHPTTSSLNEKLKFLGLSGEGESKAIGEVIRWKLDAKTAMTKSLHKNTPHFEPPTKS